MTPGRVESFPPLDVALLAGQQLVVQRRMALGKVPWQNIRWAETGQFNHSGDIRLSGEKLTRHRSERIQEITVTLNL